MHADDDRVEGFDQLCRVTGRFELDGAEHAGRLPRAADVAIRGVRPRQARVRARRVDLVRARRGPRADGVPGRARPRRTTATSSPPRSSARRALGRGRGPAPDDHVRRRRMAGPRRPRAVARRRATRHGAVPAARVRGGGGRPARSPRPASSTSGPSRSGGTAVGAMAPGSTSWPAGDEPGRAIISDFGGVLDHAAARVVRRRSCEASGISLESVGKAMATIAEREGSNPLFELETGRITEAAFMGALSDELSAERGSEVELDGFGERYFQHLKPNEPHDRVHAGAARARLQDGDLHEQHPRVGGPLAGDAPRRRDLRRRRRLGVRRQPEARAADLRDHARAARTPRRRRRCSSTTSRSTAKARGSSGSRRSGSDRPSRRSRRSRRRWRSRGDPP